MRLENNKTTIKMQEQTTTIIIGNINGQVNAHSFTKKLDRQ